jgi:hypothetical protein
MAGALECQPHITGEAAVAPLQRLSAESKQMTAATGVTLVRPEHYALMATS